MLIHSSKELAEYLRDRRKRQKLSQAEIGDLKTTPKAQN
jgi:transcriptional regulator with XRE-family HTH domain